MAEMRLVVAGAGGRMGRTLVKAIADSKEFALAGALEDARSPLIGWDAGVLAGLPREWRQADRRRRAVACQGRRHRRLHGAERHARICRRSPPRPARCTSSAPPGLSAADEAKIKDAAKSAVIVKSGNMSLGVNLLAALTKRVAKTLDNSFDIEILEMHHNQKVDAPSGTALMLGRAAADGPRHRARQAFREQPRRPHRRAQGRRHRLCHAARRHRGRRAQRDLCRRRPSASSSRTRPRTA